MSGYTGREILRICRNERRELLILQEKQEELRTSLLPKAVDIKPDVVQASGESDPMAERLADVVDMEKTIIEIAAQMHAHEAQAMRIIRGISDSRYRCLLITYYMTSYKDASGRVRLHTFETAAVTAGYSAGTMRHYHRRALRAADEAAQELFTAIHN